MSSIYIQEPPTSGKVVMETSFGDIEIELWTKECPLACRNFIQLCMEGYYNKVIFHRIIKDFIIQGGDPTGTGDGGSSIYGKPFRDEFHQRLKFTRRGMVGCANAGANDNSSQFFITLEKAPELNSKHTLFGKITGDTIFNVLHMGNVATDRNDRPRDPPFIIKTEVLNNPFKDIVPRKLTQREVDADDDEKKKKKKKRKVKAIKNFKLMSFGEEAEEEEAVVTKVGKGLVSAHDAGGDETLASAEASREMNKELLEADVAKILQKKKKDAKKKREKLERANKKAARKGGFVGFHLDEEAERIEFDRKMKEQVLQSNPNYVTPTSQTEGVSELPSEDKRTLDERVTEAKAEEETLKRDLEKSKRKHMQSQDDANEPSKKKEKTAATEFLAQQQSLYSEQKKANNDGTKKSKKSKTKSSREAQTLALLSKFSSKLSSSASGNDNSAGDDMDGLNNSDSTDGNNVKTSTSTATSSDNGRKKVTSVDDIGENLLDLDDYGEVEGGWLSHRLHNEVKHTPKGIDPSLDPNSLDLYDPRNPMNIRKRKHKHKHRDSGKDRRDHDRGRSSRSHRHSSSSSGRRHRH
eukprot:m.24074 g.24074  ORF g.24074 m.24074 type:complete len:580 (+) comp9070_c0_seq1:98-1837(+)